MSCVTHTEGPPCEVCYGCRIASLRTRLSAAEGERDRWEREAKAQYEAGQRAIAAESARADAAEAKRDARFAEGVELARQLETAEARARELEAGQVHVTADGVAGGERFDAPIRVVVTQTMFVAALAEALARADAAEARAAELEADLAAERGRSLLHLDMAEKSADGWSECEAKLEGARRSLEEARGLLEKALRHWGAPSIAAGEDCGPPLVQRTEARAAIRAFLATPSPEGKPGKGTDRG